MSRINFQRAGDFDAPIAINSRPKVKLDGGPTYDEMVLETNLAADEFSFLVEVGTDQRVLIPGTRMNEREAYDGKPATSGQFVFSFVDMVARTFQAEALSGLVTQPGQRVNVTLVIGGSIAAVTPTAQLYTVMSRNRSEEVRLYCLPESISISKVGDNEFEDFRHSENNGEWKLRRFFAYGTATHLDMRLDDRSVYGDGGLSKTLIDAQLARLGKTVPSGCLVYDPIVRGNSMLDLQDTFSGKHFKARFTNSDTTDIVAQTEYLQIISPALRAEILTRSLLA